MASRFCSSWIHLWTVSVLFRNISADPASPPRYNVHHAQVVFDQAVESCSPGVLTTLATEQEVADVLGRVSESLSPLNQKEFTFWVGLRKVKNQCVAPSLPLRGFRWTEDGGEDSQVSRWSQEPQPTCTTVRCAALKGDLDGTTVTGWGLIPVNCKNHYGFICKLRDRQTGGTPEDTETSVRHATAKPPMPKPQPAAPEPPEPEPGPATQRPEPHRPESTLPAQGPEPETDTKPTSGPEPLGPDPDPEPTSGSDSCRRPPIPGARSLSLDPDNSSRIQVDCWSQIRMELHCSGRPAVWRLPDDSPANFSAVCRPCPVGFQKDSSSGACVDVDECSGGGGGCRHTCLNTEGSFRCVCSDENQKHHDEDSPVCADMAADDDGGLLSGILIPVLIAVAALVVLVVVVVVTVKCCLMRRSKKRAMKKAEKMAMKSKDSRDSFETTNEKAAT